MIGLDPLGSIVIVGGLVQAIVYLRYSAIRDGAYMIITEGYHL